MDHKVSHNIFAATLCRLLLNTARRFPYPFAPELARELSVPLTSITSFIAVNQLSGLFALFAGPIADGKGYRVMMLWGIGILSMGMIFGWLYPSYVVIMLAFFLAGIGKSMFDPAILGYVGEYVPYHRRGTAVGATEMGWAGSTLLGIPIVGLLMARFGWTSPFLTIGILGILGWLLLFFMIPRKKPEAVPTDAGTTFLSLWKAVIREKTGWYFLGFAFFSQAANDNLFVVYGAWMEDQFGLSLVGLGTATIVIGVAELIGEGLTFSLADRIGLKRSVLWGLGLTSLCYAILPYTGTRLSTGLAGLFFLFLTFEFAIVVSISLLTEIMPEARTTMLSAFFAVAGIGRVFGAFLGGQLWTIGGIQLNCTVSAGFTMFSLGLVVLGLIQQKARVRVIG